MLDTSSDYSEIKEITRKIVDYRRSLEVISAEFAKAAKTRERYADALLSASHELRLAISEAERKRIKYFRPSDKQEPRLRS